MSDYQTEISFIASQDYMNSLSGASVLIAGASGMIGKCIIDIIMKYNETASNPIRIIACSRNEQLARERLAQYWDSEFLDFVQTDVNSSIPECGMADYIIHAAANTHPLQYSTDPIGTIETNIRGTKNLLEYAVSHHTKRFSFLSSVEIYGENRGDIELFNEEYMGYIDCNTLRAGYPESKRAGEALCNAYGQVYGNKTGFSFVIPRLSRIYGPTMLFSDSKAIAQFIKKAVAGENIVLKSEGNQIYSYTFVTDAAAAVLLTLIKGEDGAAYNIADEHSIITLKDAATILAKIAHSQVVYELPNETEKSGYSMVMKSALDSGRLRALGWDARIHMKDGLECCVEILKKKIRQGMLS